MGQSKTLAARACYAVWEHGQLRPESVEYPVDETVAKILELPVSGEVKKQLEAVLRTASIGPPRAV